MNTIVENFDGVELIRPAGGFKWPHPTFKGFPECCGAGPEGSLANSAVPESILGLPVGPICFIHDWMQTHGPKTWATFHYSNSVFTTNLLNYNRKNGGNWFVRKLREPLILAGFVGVASPAGAINFFSR